MHWRGSVPAAHEQLRALALRGLTPAPATDGIGRRLTAELTGRQAAVLVLFGVLDGHLAEHTGGGVPADLDVLLLGRAATLSQHPGQVSFPGGRIDPGDAGPEQAAIREAVEETGLDPAGVQVLGCLEPMPVPASNHVVTPVLAWWAQQSPVAVVDVGESAAVFRAPVRDLLSPAHRRTVTVRHGGVTYRTPGFVLDEHLIWGFTAKVLSQLFDELGWTEPWDTTLTVPAPI